SIIDQDVNPTEALQGLGRHRLSALGIGDVCRDSQRLTTSLLDFRNRLRARQNVRSDNISTLTCQGEAVRLAEPTSRPCDNGHSIFEPHIPLPLVVHTRLRHGLFETTCYLEYVPDKFCTTVVYTLAAAPHENAGRGVSDVQVLDRLIDT